MFKGTKADILIIDEIAHNQDLSSSARAMLDAVTESFKYGTGTLDVCDCNKLEDRVRSVHILKGRERQENEFAYLLRGSSKTRWGMDWFTNIYNLPYETVKANLNDLQGTQQRAIEGRDPLFEAMELHNARVKAGKRAIRGLFEATPLPTYINRTQGPIKAKDWEQ